jgi:antitoxin component YwqK of YwqJK toxin-antitoxin module
MIRVFLIMVFFSLFGNSFSQNTSTLLGIYVCTDTKMLIFENDSEYVLIIGEDTINGKYEIVENRIISDEITVQYFSIDSISLTKKDNKKICNYQKIMGYSLSGNISYKQFGYFFSEKGSLIRDGKCIIYNEEGDIIIKKRYKNNLLHGVYKEFYKKKLIVKGKYKKGLKSGLWHYKTSVCRGYIFFKNGKEIFRFNWRWIKTAPPDLSG